MQQKNINSLQILRAFAAISVVITHSGMKIPGINIGDLGVIGVDLFFVLSGFLMTYTFKDSRVGLSFLKARVMRIYPIYLVISAPLILSSFMQWNDADKLYNLFHNTTLIPPLHGSYDRANYVNWTLAYEMYFYVIFAIISFFFRNKIKSSIACSVAIVSIMTIIKYKYEIGYVGWYDTSLKNVLGNTIVLDFIAGSLWACIYNKIQVRPSKLISYVVCACIVIFSLEMIGNNMKGGLDYQSSLLINSSIPSFLVLCIISLTKCGTSKIEKSLVYLGEASYSIYLSHLYIFSTQSVEPIGYFLRFILLKFNVENIYTSNVILIFSAILLGIFAHEIIEKPLANWVLKKRASINNTEFVQKA
ncbi:acyltransferase [Pluralibacter sp.]|uniref:acyltransferase family protein n=1 Tax=Pluralibacter sp. TaxID=1920032 RepID=UPI0025D4BFE0|nr:acyltransferase [Pluralibacter sp.]MBV8043411.1 acyltransferase [Pluralibacter sp.]